MTRPDDNVDPRAAFEAEFDVDPYERMIAEKSASNDRAYRDAMADAATRHYRDTDPRRALDDE
jgi:hypothetical protein